MKRGGVEEERDRDRVALESENYTYFGTNFESSNYTYFGTEGVHVKCHPIEANKQCIGTHLNGFLISLNN
jgi:hypothetical protein